MIKNRTGEHYGHWIVKEQDFDLSAEKKKIYWLCECDCGCGTTKSIRSDALSQITVGGCNNMLSTISKSCLKCGKDFYPKKQAKVRKYCYDCVPEEIYNGNGNVIRKLAKKWVLDYKGNQCEICGYNKCSAALELHHLNPSEKDFNLSDRDLSLDWPLIKKEVDKCILICANCHREEHAKEER